MFKKICYLTVFSLVSISNFLVAEIKYDIQDIGTLQTHSSQAIAINDQGQILGCYNIDGSANGKHFFVRDRDGEFHEIPGKTPDAGLSINWRFLVDNGKAYGTFAVNQATTALCVWDKINGFIKLGVLPGCDVVAINNAGQVLIKSITENENGRSIRRPVIWENGKITKLQGLEGDVGIESDESCGLDMNNRGEVVGYSVAYLSYKNNIYKQKRAVKWVNGQSIDLHKEIPKSSESSATAINDLGDVIIGVDLIRSDGKKFRSSYYSKAKASKTKYFLTIENGWKVLIDRDNNKQACLANNEMFNDYNCIWMCLDEVVDMNDGGEVIAQGKTVYGEEHAMLLTPVSSN